MSVDKNMVLRQVGAKIAYWRTIKGLTQADLAKTIGFSKTTISKLECGNYNENISLSHIIDIADALKIDFSVLLQFSVSERDMWIVDEPK